MPQWLLFDQFFPPTWLTPLVNAPAVAMVWAFVLSKVCDQNPDRGIVTVPGIRPGWIRFELSPAVLLGAAVFVATNLLDGMFRLAQFQLLLAVYPLFEGRDGAFDAWARWSDALPILAGSAVAAWTYPIAAQMLRTGVFDRTRALDLMRGNRLRLTAIFFLLNLASYLFYVLHSTGHELDRPIPGGSAVVDAARSNHSTRHPISLRHVLDRGLGRHARNGDEGLGVARAAHQPDRRSVKPSVVRARDDFSPA